MWIIIAAIVTIIIYINSFDLVVYFNIDRREDEEFKWGEINLN